MLLARMSPKLVTNGRRIRILPGAVPPVSGTSNPVTGAAEHHACGHLTISGAGRAGNYDSTAVLILDITSGSPRSNACQKAVSS